jgi:hypothetical protein
MCIHVAELTAVGRGHPAEVNPEKVPDPPTAGKDAVVEDKERLQALDWVTVNCWPAIETMPERWTPVFCPATSWTVPLPDPDCPDLMPIQGTPDTAIQLHPAGAVTLAESADSPWTVKEQPGDSEIPATKTSPLYTLS